MKFDSNMKGGVIASVIASLIFFIFLEPILRAVSGILFGVGANLFRFYTDRLFEQTALLTPPDTSLFIFVGVLMFSLAFSVGVTNSRLSKWRELNGTKPPRDIHAITARLRRFPWQLIAVDVLLVVTIIIWLYSVFFQLRVITSFRQHMFAIGPYITDNESKQFYSRWTQMRSEDDYKQIYADLGRVAKANGIRLPENIVFSIKQL